MTELDVQVRVTLQVFSGQGNPSWTLTREEADALRARLGLLSPVAGVEDPHTFLWSHYYQGLLVTADGNSGLPAETLLIGPYVVTESQQSMDRDTSFDLQTWLLTTTRSPVTAELAARVARALEEVDWERPPRSFPPFDPGKWADPKIITWNNCYNYAANYMFVSETTRQASPGASVKECANPSNCQGFTLAALRDKLTLQPTGSHKEIRLALAIDPTWRIFHWYREHLAEGFWSHKIGPFTPQNHDHKGHKVVDVELADRGPYTDFCGYFYAVPGVVKLGPVSDCIRQ